MYKIIILSRNFENYRSGYYHQDIIDAFVEGYDCFLYGPGYPGYNPKDRIYDVIKKSPFQREEVDLIVCSTSWDVDYSSDEVDPHPNIKLNEVSSIPKLYFLNKEYKKLTRRLEYAKEQGFDLITTVHPLARDWANLYNLNIVQNHFGINHDRFNLGWGVNKKKIDFCFTGSLHANHLDYRYIAKSGLFNDRFINLKSNRGWYSLNKEIIKSPFDKKNIYWAEFGAKRFLGRSLLPHGKKYAELLNSSKVSLNTPSATGIFNTRFFELMASKTLILCPKLEKVYDGILVDNENCLMYENSAVGFAEKLGEILENYNSLSGIIETAYQYSFFHDYRARIKSIVEQTLCME